MNEKFVNLLEALDIEQLDESGRGRPKKEVDPEAEVKVKVKVKGKRGRPAKTVDDDTDDGKEGVRDVKLYSYITAGRGKNKQEATETKELKGISVDDIKKIAKENEYMLSVKYANKWDFDEDEINVTMKDSLGWTGARAEDQTSNDDTDSDDDYSVASGR
jgi:hypothetical protein